MLEAEAVAVTSAEYLGKEITLANCEYLTTKLSGIVTDVTISAEDGTPRVTMIKVGGIGVNITNGSSYQDSSQYYWTIHYLAR